MDSEKEKIKGKLPIACSSIDKLLGDGFEPGIITNLYGAAGSGKTIICMQAVSSCIDKNDKTAVFIDTEGSFSVERFCQISKKEKLEKIIIKDVRDFEEQIKAIEKLEDIVKKNDAGVVIVDSMVALYRLGKIGEDGAIQKANVELSAQFLMLSKIARTYNIPVIITNQVYTNFETGELELVGGDIPKYSSKCLVLLEKLGIGKRKAVLMKHRSKCEGEEAYFEINNTGISDCDKKKFGLF